MTAQKPPDKTLVGMPADLKAVLEKLDQATADNSVFSDPARGSALEPSQARPGNRPRTVPPPLPPGQGAPPSLSAPRAASSGPQDPAAAVPMDRTLIGMPYDMQEALARALAEQAHAPVVEPPAVTRPPRPAPAPVAAPRRPASAAGPALRAQPVRSVGVPSTPATEAQVPVHAGRGPVPSPKPTAAAAYQAVPPRAAPTYASGLGYDPSRSAADQAPGMNVLAPQAPLDWPPAARRSDPGLAPVRVDDEANAASALGAEPTQLALHAEPALDGNTVDATGAASAPGPRLALPLSSHDGVTTKPKRAGPAKKRWIAIAAAVLGVGALLVVGARFLPGPVAAWLGSGSDSAAATPPAADAPTLPAVPAALVTDTAAATDPARFTPTPTRPPAAPVMTSGASAQLEKKAIERLVANDYPAAKQLYEKLRSAEPTRPEFVWMVELLNRAGSLACGQPGQAPCAGVEP